MINHANEIVFSVYRRLWKTLEKLCCEKGYFGKIESEAVKVSTYLK